MRALEQCSLVICVYNVEVSQPWGACRQQWLGWLWLRHVRLVRASDQIEFAALRSYAKIPCAQLATVHHRVVGVPAQAKERCEGQQHLPWRGAHIPQA
jgi:hypothetical protein